VSLPSVISRGAAGVVASEPSGKAASVAAKSSDARTVDADQLQLSGGAQPATASQSTPPPIKRIVGVSLLFGSIGALLSFGNWPSLAKVAYTIAWGALGAWSASPSDLVPKGAASPKK